MWLRLSLAKTTFSYECTLRLKVSLCNPVVNNHTHMPSTIFEDVSGVSTLINPKIDGILSNAKPHDAYVVMRNTVLIQTCDKISWLVTLLHGSVRIQSAECYFSFQNQTMANLECIDKVYYPL